MAEGRVQRRLSAILAADLVGYSRLMEADEEGTRTRLTDLLTKVIEPQIATEGGRVVKTLGDGILVEFPSAVDAVRSALAIQSAVTEHNTRLAEGQQLVFRIGINVGDVIIEGDDIHGDGVNVAARLEGLCQPGEVYISRTVHDHVDGKIAARFEDLGEQSVKNISRPVRAFRAFAFSEGGQKRISNENFYSDPDKPAIAVLPFENVSGDAEQAYFADGITEDIITELSRFPELMVISRNSTFTYKDKVTKPQDVCKDLGADYVVEGRVRKAGNRVRINAQLIDGHTGGHLWAERYDRELEDIFSVQDDVTEKIVWSLEIKLVRSDTQLDARNRFHNTEAYDCVLRGREQYRLFTVESNAAARELYQRAVELDPDYAEPYAGLAETYVQDWFMGTKTSLDPAFNLAQEAAKRDATLPLVQEALSTVHLFQGRHKEAMETARRWIELEPSSADAYATLAGAMHFAGENDGIIGLIEKAMSLNPLYPFFYPHYLGLANIGLRRYEAAVVALRRGANRNPEALWPHVFLAACLGHLQKNDEAAAEVAEVRRISPDFSIEAIRKLLPYRNSEDFDQLVDGLKKVGLSAKPEEEAPLLLPDKPSIAVLPFKNMSGDPEQEYFSDGITEDIITALSRIRWFLVIARNSSFSYKGTSPDIRQVAKDLGVRYVLVGSVRKAGNRVRINAQLIDADTGSHIWVERYDRELEDIFAVQDEITQTVVGAIEPELSRAEQERARLKPPESPDAWDCYQRGQWHFNRITPNDLSRAKSMFRTAIDLDSGLGAAYSGLATTCFYEFILGAALPQTLVEPAYEAARKALEIDPNDAVAQVALALAYQLDGKQSESIPFLEAAIALNPSLARGHYYLGAALTFSGRGMDAIYHLETAIRLSPRDPWIAHFMARLSEAHLFANRLDDAVAWGRKARSQSGPWAWTARLGLASALGHLGRLEEAQTALEEMRAKRPDVSLSFVRTHFPVENDADRTSLLEGLGKAGLTE